MKKITYKFNGIEYNEIPPYLEKDGKMIPAAQLVSEIEIIETDIAEPQIVKSDKLKQAENDYLALLASLPVTLEPGDNSDTITQKLEASGMTELEAVKIGLKLLNGIHEVEIKGGSWYDLPSVPHNLEG